MSKKEWGLLGSIIALVILIDYFTKSWAFSLTTPIDFKFIKLSLVFNNGTMLGFLSELPQLLKVVTISTTGMFLVISYFIILYMLPIQSLVLNIGLSIFLGGILGNVLDRIYFGKVIDFIQISITDNFHSAFFNLADLFQLLGFAAVLFIVIKDGEKIWRENNKRKAIWVNSKFQLKYSLILLMVGMGISLVSVVFSYTYLKMTIIEIAGDNPILIARFATPFLVTFIIIAFSICLILFLFGKIISHKIAGPIYAFEKYLNEAIDSKVKNSELRDFKLRSDDDFKELEDFARLIKENISTNKDHK